MTKKINTLKTLLFINNKKTIKDEQIIEFCNKNSLNVLLIKESDITVTSEGELIILGKYSIENFGFVFLGIFAHIMSRDENSIIYKDIYEGLQKQFFNFNPFLFDYIKNNIKESKRIIYGKMLYYNKVNQLLFFAKNKINYIPTYITKDANFLENIIKEGVLNFPLIIKPYLGSRGFGVKKIDDKDNLFEEVKNSKTQLIVQPFIPNNCDYRVYILKDKILGIMKRTSQDISEFRNNISLGGFGEKADLPDDIKEQCIKITKAMGLDVAGVDVIQDLETKKYYIIEVNSSPHYEGFLKATGINPIEEIIKYIKNVIQSNS